jgi:hypothetical protein
MPLSRATSVDTTVSDAPVSMTSFFLFPLISTSATGIPAALIAIGKGFAPSANWYCSIGASWYTEAKGRRSFVGSTGVASFA